MVFTRTKRTAAKVADELTERGFAAAAVHGDLGQGAREQALRAFRSGKVDVLVATDVAARGIDVDDVTHVINYQCPEEDKTYIHRIGRTGRAGKTGIAVSFIDWDDVPRWKLINESLGLDFADPAGDLLHLQAPVRGPGHPRGRHRPAAVARSGSASRPGRRGGRGPGRDRRQATEGGQPDRRRPRRSGPTTATAPDAVGTGGGAATATPRTTSGTRRRTRKPRNRTRGGQSAAGADG